MSLNIHDRNKAVQRARQLVRDKFGYQKEWCSALCVPEAVALMHVLRTQFRAVMATFQAGSHSWPMIRPEDDDGVCSTHFSYIWETSPTTAMRLMMNELPELHAWVVVKEPGIPVAVVDISTRNHKAQMARLVPNQKWTAADPPDYLWCPVDELHHDVIYKVDVMATIVALQFAVSSLLQR